LVDLDYNFECDWFIELSENNLASELGGKGIFKPITIEEIVSFMINDVHYAVFSFQVVDLEKEQF